MARQGGLGPLGRAAVERAADEDKRGSKPVDIGPIRRAPPRGNPAAIDEQDPNEQRPPDDWYVFDSSRVSEAAYDADTQTLYVRFVKPRPIGTPWVYNGVQANEWRNFRRSQSPGKYVNRVLNQHDYHRGTWGG